MANILLKNLNLLKFICRNFQSEQTPIQFFLLHCVINAHLLGLWKLTLTLNYIPRLIINCHLLSYYNVFLCIGKLCATLV